MQPGEPDTTAQDDEGLMGLADALDDPEGSDGEADDELLALAATMSELDEDRSVPPPPAQNAAHGGSIESTEAAAVSHDAAVDAARGKAAAVQPARRPNAAARGPCSGAAPHEPRAAGGSSVAKNHLDGVVVEPMSGLAYRKPRISSVDLAALLDSAVSFTLSAASLRITMPGLEEVPFSTVAVIGKRDAKEASNGNLYLKWRLTDLKQCTVTCMVFGDAAVALSQLTAGTLVAIVAPMYDGKGEGSLKITKPSAVTAIGQAADFGFCQGTTRDGKACSMIVNTSVCRMCDWHLNQISTQLANNARPEFRSNALVTAFAPKAKQLQSKLSRQSSVSTWQDKLGSLTPKKRTLQTNGQLSTFLEGRRATAGTKALQKFLQQQEEDERRKRSKAGRPPAPDAAAPPAATAQLLQTSDAVPPRKRGGDPTDEQPTACEPAATERSASRGRGKDVSTGATGARGLAASRASSATAVAGASKPVRTGAAAVRAGLKAPPRQIADVGVARPRPVAGAVPRGAALVHPPAKRKLAFAGAPSKCAPQPEVADGAAPSDGERAAGRPFKSARVSLEDGDAAQPERSAREGGGGDAASVPLRGRQVSSDARTAEPFAQSHRDLLDNPRSKKARQAGAQRPDFLGLGALSRTTAKEKVAAAAAPAPAAPRCSQPPPRTKATSAAAAGLAAAGAPCSDPSSRCRAVGTQHASTTASAMTAAPECRGAERRGGAAPSQAGSIVRPESNGMDGADAGSKPAGFGGRSANATAVAPAQQPPLLTDLCLRQSSDAHLRAKAAMRAQATRGARAPTAPPQGARAPCEAAAAASASARSPLKPVNRALGPGASLLGNVTNKAAPMSEAAMEAVLERAARQGAPGQSDFERAFADVVADVELDGEHAERILACADDEEWRQIMERAKVAAEQERAEERMAGCMEMKVAAFRCETCGVLAEKRHPRCVGHDVKTVQVVKRWFKCGQCGGKTTTLARRLPNRQCPKCKVYDFEECSMYSTKQDVLWEDNLAAAGIADKSLLKVRGEERKWVFS